MADPFARGLEAEFRLPDDPEHVIRINQPHPPGLARKLAEFVAVVGTTQPNTSPTVHSFICGSNRHVELRRMPEHEVDHNAIAVIGCWQEENSERHGQLGYIPADVAAQLKNEEQDTVIGATLKAIYVPVSGKSAGLRLDIWAPRRRPERAKERPRCQNVQVPSDPVERNLRGMELEAEGLIDNAIECYEANLRDGFGGNHPYDRLAIIFRRRGDVVREVGVLKRAIEVFEQLQNSRRSDVAAKLERFRQRLHGLMERSKEAGG